ncbi:YcxB family protein [Flavobacterium capsici]|uniref:YcxB family protein n=1 Tax=Flavobacterium capsici TaxID=3075618 RepID=A0AA96ETW9_9FLAO|nr:YcxB family protein [Flavobacterium sp. PMR2A8]WNM18171.1 YcxB family protein [Flavobacterium sp. PMR2A8]
MSIIEEIIEIKDYIYLKIKTGGYFILPKSKIENVTEVQINLASLAEKLKINYTKELEWKWK